MTHAQHSDAAPFGPGGHSGCQSEKNQASGGGRWDEQALPFVRTEIKEWTDGWTDGCSRLQLQYHLISFSLI